MNLLNKLPFDGYKSYIGFAIMFIAGGLSALSIIDAQTFTVLLTLGGSIAGIGVAHKMDKSK